MAGKRTRGFRLTDVPREYIDLFNLLAEVREEMEGKTRVEVFAEMVMNETERRYGKKEAERSLWCARSRYVPDDEPL